ncbi:hypothetical protein BS17DRAFT_384168 [Gyrodon lividus]|nr:hypothetical protein BS17DRAFT_384168 [Gyrodon lividus]
MVHLSIYFAKLTGVGPNYSFPRPGTTTMTPTETSWTSIHPRSVNAAVHISVTEDKLSHNNLKAALSVLPVELWLEILHHATFVSGILEPDIYHHTEAPSTYFNYRRYSIMLDALRTKCSLVLVCKQWRRICTPLLYQSIIVRNTRSWEVLADTFTKSRDQCSASDDSPLGSFTKRLDLAQTIWRNHDLNLLRCVMRCLPNLSILSFSMTRSAMFAMSRCIIDDVLPLTPHLRVIDATWSIQSGDFERLLKDSPQLRMLRCVDVPLYHLADDDLLVASSERDTLVMPNITNLSIYESFNPHGFCSYFTFPSLCELSCHLQTTTTTNVQELFFERHGSNLKSLHLQQYGSSSADNTRNLLWIKQYCPALRSLTISLGDWQELPIHPVSIPDVGFLGLRCAREGLEFRQYQLLFRFLESLDEKSSTLRTVQFLDPVNTSDMFRFDGCRVFMMDFIKRGKLRLVDHVGSSLEEYL